MSSSFAQALVDRDLTALAAAAKVEHHRHSIFGVSLERIEAWTGQTIAPAPRRIAGLEDMRSYAERVLYPHIDGREGFEFTAREAVRQAAQEGVCVLEMSLDVKFARYYPGGVEGFAEFVEDLRASCPSGIELRPELGLSRRRNLDDWEPTVRRCVDSGAFLSIDLYGDEREAPTDVYRDLFLYARRKGLKAKAHAGEFAGAESVRTTVELLELREVQHGVRAAESAEVLRWLAAEGIVLNLCPTSNLRLGVVRTMASYPIGAILDAGIRVTLNTDDPTIFGTTVSGEYLSLYEHGVLSAEELDGVRRMCLDG